MPVVKRQALVAQPPGRMFELVNDVERYPEHFNWCRRVDLLEQTGNRVSARLHVRAGGIEFSFATRNTLSPPDHIHLDMLEGPLRYLKGDWTFRPYGDGGCRIDLVLDFEPKSRLFGLATTLAFQALADRLVQDFTTVAAAGG